MTSEHMTFIEFVLTIFISVMASSGFWMFISKKTEVSDCNKRLLLALAHDRIVYLSIKYIENGTISQDEYENLHFLCKPYFDIGGNGTALRLFDEVKKLPINKKISKGTKNDSPQ
jgi:hypothetical protein